MGNKFNKEKCAASLRQAVTRMNIHRQKKLNHIAKKKDDICNHLTAQNEVNAKIWGETLINDENQIPCYDIACTMCDQIRGRLEYMAKFGPPKDMQQTFATVIHLAPKLGVEELEQVRKQLTALLGDEFVMQADEDKTIINPMVAEKIDFIKPEDGQIIYRLRQLAKERNIEYEPSHDMRQALNAYCDRKGLLDPMDNGQSQAQFQMPVYNPQQQAPYNPGNDNQGGPPNMPPGGGPGGPGGGGQMQQQPGMHQPPMYIPQQPNMNMPPQQMPPQQMPPQMQPPPQQMNIGPPQGQMPAYDPSGMGGGGQMPPGPPQGGNFGSTAGGPGGPPVYQPPPAGGQGGEIDDLEARLRALDNN